MSSYVQLTICMRLNTSPDCGEFSGDESGIYKVGKPRVVSSCNKKKVDLNWLGE